MNLTVAVQWYILHIYDIMPKANSFMKNITFDIATRINPGKNDILKTKTSCMHACMHACEMLHDEMLTLWQCKLILFTEETLKLRYKNRVGNVILVRQKI